MKIDEKAASWNRVKLSVRASSRLQKPFQAANLQPLKSRKSHEILRNANKSMKMHEIKKSHEIFGKP